MKILALDLGTTTGYAYSPAPGAVVSGTWSFKPGRYDGGGMRYLRLRKALDDFKFECGLDAVYFEEVRAHKGVDAAHVYGGMLATLTAWCEDARIPYEGVGVGTIKKFWTGKGNAPKDDMIAKARQLGYQPMDDNEADALALLHLKAKIPVPCSFPDCECDCENNGRHECRKGK